VIAFDATGTRVAIGGDDGFVRVWRLDSSGAAVEKQLHDGPVRDVTFSPDGRLASAGNDGTAKVWDLARGRVILAGCSARVVGDGGPPAMTTVRFDALGLLAAAGDDSGTGCVWQTFSGEVISPLRGHRGAINAIRWAADLSWVATASDDGTAGIWSPYFGKLIVQPLRHDRAVTALAITGERTLVTGDSEGGLHLWKLPAQRPFGDDGNIRAPVNADVRLSGHAGAVVAIAVSPDGSLLATAGADRLAKLWNAATGQPIATFEQSDALTSLAFAGSALATGSTDGTSRLWNTTAVKPRIRVLDSPVHALAISRTGVLAAARDDTYISLGDGDTTLDGHDRSVLAAVFTPDGSRLITAGADSRPFVWDVARKVEAVKLPDVDKPGPLQSMAAAPDGVRFASAGADVRVWSLATPDSVSVLDSAGAHIDVLAYAPAGDVLVGGGIGGALRVWTNEGAPVVQKLNNDVTALAFSPDGHAIAIAAHSTVELRAFDGAQIAAHPSMLIEGTPGLVRTIVFACGGACLVTGGESGIAEVWDVKSGKRLATRDPGAGAISGLALGDGGETLWIATEGNIVGAWPLRVETRPVSALECFAAAHVPWRLGADDVVSRREGELHGQRGSDCK
jgi:WD40 repeat protein